MFRNSVRAVRTVIDASPRALYICPKHVPWSRMLCSFVISNDSIGRNFRQLNYGDTNVYSPSFKRYYCISQPHIVQMRGLDFEAKEQDVIDFFKPLYITPLKIHLRCDISGRITGLCEVEFATHAEAVIAMRKRNAFIGNRFIRLNLKSASFSSEEEEKINEENKENERHKGYGSSGGSKFTGNIERSLFPTGNFVRMRNLPTRITEQTLFQFFWPLNIHPISVRPVYDCIGNKTGEFDVEFLSQEDAVKAISKNSTYIGHRLVEVVLNSSINSSGQEQMASKRS